jgi:hypothetical protein
MLLKLKPLWGRRVPGLVVHMGESGTVVDGHVVGVLLTPN